MLVSPLAQEIAAHLRMGITAEEISSEVGIPLERVQAGLDELQRESLVVTKDGYTYNPVPEN